MQNFYINRVEPLKAVVGDKRINVEEVQVALHVNSVIAPRSFILN